MHCLQSPSFINWIHLFIKSEALTAQTVLGEWEEGLVAFYIFMYWLPNYKVLLKNETYITCLHTGSVV